ncbi:hypothetical protein ACET60_04290 [Aeromonas veronii]|uniref:hypothetical protein n=1 Tax=Aeromonas veronii TaxID=654 RepID=UPI0011183164|nr:hypothetical protein [Aeromonas veronii]MBL0472438.1 hypothetical protein [Aeromonas veronii]MBL0563809.1 hypothetical protein [Aeromonas veronii]TNI12989.1 hypothetical protein CF106_09950 [Aeromonas veronii]
MTITEQCIALAHHFRLGLHVESALQLPALVEQALHTLPPEHQGDAVTIVSALLACQEHHDWLGLADWLEVEFATLLTTPEK